MCPLTTQIVSFQTKYSLLFFCTNPLCPLLDLGTKGVQDCPGDKHITGDNKRRRLNEHCQPVGKPWMTYQQHSSKRHCVSNKSDRCVSSACLITRMLIHSCVPIVKCGERHTKTFATIQQIIHAERYITDTCWSFIFHHCCITCLHISLP